MNPFFVIVLALCFPDSLKNLLFFLCLKNIFFVTVFESFGRIYIYRDRKSLRQARMEQVTRRDIATVYSNAKRDKGRGYKASKTSASSSPVVRGHGEGHGEELVYTDTVGQNGGENFRVVVVSMCYILHFKLTWHLI